MHVLWFVLGLALLAAIAVAIVRSQGRSRPADLGFVSHQWVAEHRMQSTDLQR